jgi:hypothetical protein
MTPQEAKSILLLYRPGTTDAMDPTFADALNLCERDAELKAWFENHCALYLALRAKFKGTQVPEGLKEQILAERNLHVPARKPARLVPALAAILIVLVGVSAFWLLTHPPQTYPIFRDRMVSKAFRTYGMDLTSEDPGRVRAYLAGRQAPSEFELPPGLASTRLVGCVATSWRGYPVSMICFNSRRSQDETDLWLFVVDHGALSGGPQGEDPRIRYANGVATASWTRSNQTYVLVMQGREEEIRQYL